MRNEEHIINISPCQSSYPSIYKPLKIIFDSPPFSRFLLNLGWLLWRARRPRLATRWSPLDWTCRRSGPKLRPSYRSVPTHILLSLFFVVRHFYWTLLGVSIQIPGYGMDECMIPGSLFVLSSLSWTGTYFAVSPFCLNVRSLPCFSVYVLFASVLVMVLSGVGVSMPVPIVPLFFIIFVSLS